MTRLLGLSITVASLALGVMCADIIQHMTFGGYVWMLGIALAGGSFVAGVYMTLVRP